MKITFAYLPEEKPEADAVLSAVRQLHPGARVKRIEKPDSEYLHTYLTTKTGKRTCKTSENVV